MCKYVILINTLHICESNMYVYPRMVWCIDKERYKGSVSVNALEILYETILPSHIKWLGASFLEHFIWAPSE